MGDEELAECCSTVHLFDAQQVLSRWWPTLLRCLIIGESPGEPGASYFYDPIPQFGRDPVAVRRNLLPALASLRVMTAPTLPAFRDAGLAFDHAIRCQIPLEEVRRVHRLALAFRSPRAANAKHIAQLLAIVPKVSVTGHIARNALADACSDVPKIGSCVSPSYEIGNKFLISRYLTRVAQADVARIVRQSQPFLGAANA